MSGGLGIEDAPVSLFSDWLEVERGRRRNLHPVKDDTNNILTLRLRIRRVTKGILEAVFWVALPDVQMPAIR